MMEHLGGMVMIALVLFLVVLVAASRMQVRWLVAGGLLMRIIGAGAMLLLIFGVWGGAADAIYYFNVGSAYAERMLSGDFGMVTDPRQWTGGAWWGTHFVNVITTPVAAILGPRPAGAFLLFSLLSFTGLCLFAAAFARAYPHVPVTNYARWLFFFPSLWLWPSVIGKEALILLGFGMFAYGYFRQGSLAWLPTLAGMLLVFFVRPQVAAVIALSVLAAEWLRRGQRWSVLRVAQGVAILALGGVVVYFGVSQVAEQSGVSGAGEYLEMRSSVYDVGGSNIETAGTGIAAIPQAIVTTLFRPFLWEARSPLLLATALEISFFWMVALFRWRRIAAALRAWRDTRFAATGLPFVLVYAVTFGMVAYNLGIVARQRIFIFPFLFAIMEAVPESARQHPTAPPRGHSGVRLRTMARRQAPLPAR